MGHYVTTGVARECIDFEFQSAGEHRRASGDFRVVGICDHKNTRDATRNGDDSHTSGTGARRPVQVAREFSTRLLKCQPLNLNALRSVGLTQFLKRCEGNNQVEKYVGGLPDTIHGSVMATKPKTMQDAIEFATELMDKKINTWAERQADNKRKSNDTARNNQNQQPNKRNITLEELSHGNGDRRPYGGPKPLHFKKDCLKLKNNNNRGNQVGNAKAQAKVYAVGNVEQTDNNVITYHAIIVCAEKIVRVPFGDEILIVRGDRSSNKHGTRLNIILILRLKSINEGMSPILKKYHRQPKTRQVKGETTEVVPIVQNFLKSFRGLAGIPPTRQVEFRIDWYRIKAHKPSSSPGELRSIVLKRKMGPSELCIDLQELNKLTTMKEPLPTPKDRADLVEPYKVNEARGAKDTLGILFWGVMHKRFGVITSRDICYDLKSLLSNVEQFKPLRFVLNNFNKSNVFVTNPVMSSTSIVTYTSVYTDSEPVRVFLGANEELSDGGSLRVIVYGYDGLPMQLVAPPSPNYVPGPEHPPRSPVCWAEVGQVQLTGPELVQETTERVIQIKQRIQTARDRQKRCADLKHKPMEFQVRDKVMLKVGTVAYKLEIPQELSRVHNTFHVSNLKKCYSDDPLVVPLEGLQVDDKLHFVEEPVEIMDRKVKQLRRSRLLIFKV
ncbi:hypothetical protein Tco_1104094 [Tanacetum coccineum]